MRGLHLDYFRSEPGETECLTAIWSEGRSCKDCWIECYRRGWKKPAVDADNRAMVKAKANFQPWPPKPKE